MRLFSTTPVKVALAIALIAPASLSAQISEDFNDITTLAGQGWVLKNNSAPIGVTGWFQGNNTVFAAYNGVSNAYIGANFNNTSGAGNISNWLITPLQTLTNGSVFSFFTRTVDLPQFADRLELRMSTNGGSSDVGTTDASVGDFSALLLSVNPTLSVTGFPNSWTQYSATVSGLASSVTGRFALRYSVPNGGAGANSDYIGIDAVRYTANAVPEPSSFALVGFGLTALVGVAARRRRA